MSDTGVQYDTFGIMTVYAPESEMSEEERKHFSKEFNACQLIFTSGD